MPHTPAFETDLNIEREVERYASGKSTRRELLQSLIAITGSYAAAHLLLESSGVAATLIAQREAAAANVDTETVSYPSGNIQVQAYLAKPRGAGRHRAVIVIHENRGLNEHIRDVARRLAGEGFLAMAPDLLSRSGGTGSMRTPAEATEALNAQPAAAAIDDLKAGFDFLAKRADVEAQRISSVGFCWGGWRSFMLATQAPELYRTVVFYGSTPHRGLENIRAAVLGHYAEWDYAITGNALFTSEEMQRAGKRFQYHVYPNTDHAFFNDTGPRYDEAAAKLAWQRTLEFLRG
jgi:carboxymethylenebutenolidase